jgi:hypothetical protein
MESKIPLPTDNIYKFYALFGLLLFITAVVGVVVVNTSAAEKIHLLVKEYQEIGGDAASKESNPLAKIIEKRLDVTVKNKEFFYQALGVLIAFAMYLMFYGFVQWHKKIQPRQDELLDLQIERLRLEVARLKTSESE